MEMATSSISEELYKELKKEFLAGKSLRKLEDEYGINRKAISRMLKSEGVHTGKSYSDDVMEKAISLFKQGRSIRSITIELGVDKNIIANRFEEMGIRSKRTPKRKTQAFKMTPETDEIVRLYTEELNSIKSIADMHGRSTNYIWKTLRYYGVVDSDRKFKLYDCNEHAFDEIDSEATAYWLGFLMADGYVNKEYAGMELSLKAKDKNHIQKFLDFMESNHPILDKIVKIDDHEFIACRATIRSKHLAKQLAKHGCAPRKSLTLKFPKIKMELLHHFMRGYFDGDGTVTTSALSRGRRRLHFGIVGTEDFLDIFESHLYKLGINHNKYQRCGNAWQTQHSGNSQAQIFFDFLYKDATVYLDRKYDLFTAVLGRNA
jgi:hypothetical protein